MYCLACSAENSLPADDLNRLIVKVCYGGNCFEILRWVIDSASCSIYFAFYVNTFFYLFIRNFWNACVHASISKGVVIAVISNWAGFNECVLCGRAKFFEINKTSCSDDIVEFLQLSPRKRCCKENCQFYREIYKVPGRQSKSYPWEIILLFKYKNRANVT